MADVKIDEIPYALRLPKKVHSAMQKLAQANRRSLNAEIIVACENHAAKKGVNHG